MRRRNFSVREQMNRDERQNIYGSQSCGGDVGCSFRRRRIAPEMGGFVAASSGLEEAVNYGVIRTAGIVGYIGDWHSHPP